MPIPKSKKLRIDFVTLSRSDYTSLKPVIQHCALVDEFKIGVIAGGSHLLNRFGHTIDEIERDFEINKVISFLSNEDDNEIEFANAYAKAIAGFVELFSERKPDAIFILGDRWELLSVATAATILRIPLIHHSGGDITQGALDNQIRYSISALAHIHLVALEEHSNRLKAMGEEDWRISVVGEPALSAINVFKPSLDNFYKRINISPNQEFVLATFHPTAYEKISFENQIDIFLDSLNNIELPIVLTAPNPDLSSHLFLKNIEIFAHENSNIKLINTLGRDHYYTALSTATFMIGNSSSGIWEAPSFGLPVINIGCRQKDRFRANNVIDVPLEINEISRAIKFISEGGLAESLDKKNPYFRKDCLSSIADDIQKAMNNPNLLYKNFQDPLNQKFK